MLRKILIFLLLTSPAFATDSPRLLTYPPQKIMGFRGLDTLSNAPLLEDGRAVDLKNVKLSESFDMRQRDGFNTINDTTLDDLDLSSPAITGIFDATFSNSTSFPIVFLGNKLKYDNSGTWTEIGNSWEASPITTGQDNQWQCVMALDTAICTNDVDVPMEISSTPAKSALDVSDLTDTLTKTKTIAFFRNYFILANTVEAGTERPTRFRWSDVGTTETYQDDNFVDISALAGDEIVGLAEIYGNIYAFLNQAIYKVTLVGGNDIFNFDKVIEGFGAIARDSIRVVRVGNNQSAIIFLNKDKRVFLFNGLVVQDVGKIIQPTLDDINGARIQYAASAYDGKSYYLAVSNGSATTNDRIFEFQVEIGEWTLHTDIDANAMASVRNNNITKTYFGNYESFVYWMDDPDLVNDVDGALGQVDSVGQDDGVTITSAQTIIDAALPTGGYTGAIIKIESGTAVGQESVIIDHTATSLTVATVFTTTPDSTSFYSIGAIDAAYETKWYDLGDSPRKKNFKELFMWAKEASNNEVAITYSKDFSVTIDSVEENLAPATSALWDSGLWDVAKWGTTGDKLHRIDMKGKGRFVSFNFENDSIDESFHIYGYTIIADALDIR